MSLPPKEAQRLLRELQKTLEYAGNLAPEPGANPFTHGMLFGLRMAGRLLAVANAGDLDEQPLVDLARIRDELLAEATGRHPDPPPT